MRGLVCESDWSEIIWFVGAFVRGAWWIREVSLDPECRGPYPVLLLAKHLHINTPLGENVLSLGRQTFTLNCSHRLLIPTCESESERER